MKNELRAKFERDGFVGPFPLYTPEEAARRLRQIRIGNLDRRRAIYANEVNYDRHFDIPELADHITRPGIVSVLQQILGPDLLCWRSEFFPKFPGAHGTPWHQVETYQYGTGTAQLQRTLPPDGLPMELTVWTAFTDATRENGCLKLMPGSHKTLYFDESKDVTTGRTGDYSSQEADAPFYGYDFDEFKVDADWTPDENQAVAMEMRAGEFLVFTARCMHGSYPNTTRRTTRFGLAARYTPTHVRVYPEHTVFREHGGVFDLADHGCVLVGGKDQYGHNRIRTHDAHDTPFRAPLQFEEA